MDVHIFVSHTALLLKQHVLFKLHASKFKMPVAVILQWTHTGPVENIITVCLHALSGGNVQQLHT